jgi:muramoyltetrapeptide carboxypeptidase
MLVGAANEYYVFTFQPEIAGIDISRDIYPCQVPDMNRPVGIGKSCRDKVSFVLFHCGTKIMVIREKNAYFVTMMQLPPFLSPGDKVGITAPARWVNEQDIEPFMDALEKEGWVVHTGSLYRKNNQYSGTDEERLKDLQVMLDDPEIRAVFCARGGYGTARLLDGVDLNAFSASPKWISGFSDITALHACILMKIGTAVLHSGMPYTLRNGREDPGLASLLDTLSGTLTDYKIPPHEFNREGLADGILLGGNLSVLYSLTGTPYQVPTRGAVLFLEDVDEYLYHIDRMMLSLKMAGLLEQLEGLVIGGMTDMNDNEIPFGKTAYEIIRDAVEPYGFPVCFGFPAGHQEPNLPLVLGREVHLEVNRAGCTMDYLQ